MGRDGGQAQNGHSLDLGKEHRRLGGLEGEQVQEQKAVTMKATQRAELTEGNRGTLGIESPGTCEAGSQGHRQQRQKTNWVTEKSQGTNSKGGKSGETEKQLF